MPIFSQKPVPTRLSGLSPFSKYEAVLFLGALKATGNRKAMKVLWTAAHFCAEVRRPGSVGAGGPGRVI
jgi:hypothetical protein